MIQSRRPPLAAVVVAVAVAVVTMTTWGTAVGGLRRYCPVEAHAVVDDQGSVFVLYFSALMIGSFFFLLHAVLGVVVTTRFLPSIFFSA